MIFQIILFTVLCLVLQTKHLALADLSQDDRVGHLMEIGAVIRKLEGMSFFNEFLTNLQPVLITNIDRCDADARNLLTDTFQKLPECDARDMIMLKLSGAIAQS